MRHFYIIALLILLLTGTSVYAESNDLSTTGARAPLESLELIPDNFGFLGHGHPDDSSINESGEIDLNQLLNSYSVDPTIQFNLTDRIRSNNKNKSVTVWGGVIPFFSIPDPDKREQDSSISKENFSIFWHLKKRF